MPASLSLSHYFRDKESERVPPSTGSRSRKSSIIKPMRDREIKGNRKKIRRRVREKRGSKTSITHLRSRNYCNILVKCSLPVVYFFLPLPETLSLFFSLLSFPLSLSLSLPLVSFICSESIECLTLFPPVIPCCLISTWRRCPGSVLLHESLLSLPL